MKKRVMFSEETSNRIGAVKYLARTARAKATQMRNAYVELVKELSGRQPTEQELGIAQQEVEHLKAEMNDCMKELKKAGLK